MIDRYTLGITREGIKQRFNIDVPEDYKATYNAAPTQKLPVITNINPKSIVNFNWGLMAPLSNGKTISPRLYSTKVETIRSKASLKDAVANRKCVILCDGFYLWNRIAKKRQVPYYFYSSDQSAFGIAGFWEENEDLEHGTKSFAFNMIMTPSIEKMLKYGTEGLPAVIKKGQEQAWLEDEDYEVEKYLDPNFHESLGSHSVSPMIQDLKNDSIDLIKNKPPADQLGNYTLFG